MLFILIEFPGSRKIQCGWNLEVKFGSNCKLGLSHMRKAKKTALSSLGFPTFCTMNSVKMVKELLEMPEFRFQNIPGRDAFVELIT